MASAKLINKKGLPRLVIDGTPYPLTQAITIRSFDRKAEKVVVDPAYINQLYNAGIRLFYIPCDTEWGNAGAHQRFKEECELLLRQAPDAYIMVRVGLHPPNTWAANNPDECFTYNSRVKPSVTLANETFSKTHPHLYSMASSVWRNEASTALNNTCSFIDELPFADRVIGYFFAAGGTSEWYYLLDLEKGEEYGDFSKAFLREYSLYLKRKYKTDSNLQRAWRDSTATISCPKIPTLKDRFFAKQFDATYWREDEATVSDLTKIIGNGTNIGSFLNPETYLYVADFYNAWHAATANSQVHFAKIIKKRYDNQRLTGAFYGSYGCTDFFNGSTCTATLEILDSGYMDFLAAPGVYVNRQVGGFTGQREMQDSFTLRNMIFITEEDTRTHLEVPHFRAMFNYYSIEDSINVLKRDFGRNICDGLGAWWYEHEVGGNRYKHPQIIELFARQSQIARLALQLSKNKGNEVALVYDQESVHYISNQSTKELVEYFRNYELARIGLGCDQYFHNDLANPNMPDYKLYIFFNALSLTDSEREVIHAKLAKNHAVALWIYASGVINTDASQRFSVNNIEDLTRIKIDVLHEKCHTKYRVVDNPCRLLSEIDNRDIFGFNSRPYASNILVMVKDVATFAAPLFYSVDKDAITIAQFLTNELPAISYKQADGFKSIFHGAKILSSEIARAIASFAGCHVYCKSDDVIYVNNSFFCIHATTDGEKTITFKERCSPFELYQRRYYSTKTQEIKVEMQRGQTLMFCLEGDLNL